MRFLFLNSPEDENEKNAIKKLIANSVPSQDFFVLISLSVLLATLGLLVDNLAIIIGGMLVAPLLHPILELSLGISILDLKLILKSLYTIIKSIIIGVILAAITVTILEDNSVNYLSNPLINNPGTNNLIYFIIAIVSGFVASFSLIKPKLNERLIGVAISVALVPPISIIGIGLAQFNWEIIKSSSTILYLNVLGILLSSITTFISVNLIEHRQATIRAMKKEEKIIKKES